MPILSSITNAFPSFTPGLRLIDGGDCQAMANLLFGSQVGIVAKVGGTNLTSPVLGAAFSEVDTSTNSNTDGVVLPPAIPGSQIIVNNNTGNTITIFAQQSNLNNPNAAGSPQADQIVAHASTALVAGNVGVTLATGLLSVFACFKPGIWKQGLSA